MNDNRAYAISAADLKTLERNLNYLANNVDNVDTKVLDANERIKSVSEEVKHINNNIKQLISEIRETTILTNAKQSISLAQDEINKKYGHYDKIRRKISGLFQSIEIGSIEKDSIKEIKEKALIEAPDYWLSSALVAICAWLSNNEEECINALKDSIKKDDEKTSLFFSIINLKFDRYTSSFLWLKRYLDMQDSSKIENKIVPILDTLTSGIFDKNEKEYFLNKMFTWTNELSNTTNYKNAQINRWVDYLIYLLDEQNFDEYYYIKNYTNKYDDINRITNISVSQKNIEYFFSNLINEKDEIEISSKDQINKIINLLIYNYENEELDLRKDIAKNKMIVEENGDTVKANNKYKLSEFAYLKNNDFYSLLSNIVLKNDELKSSINTKKLSLSLIKNIIVASYNHLYENDLDNFSITIKINNWTSTTTNGKNEKELLKSLYNHIDKETHLDIESTKLFDIKMLFTLVFGVVCSIIIALNNMIFISVIIALATILILFYSLFTNYKMKNEKIKKREQRKEEEKEILLNVISEIVDFSFIYEDGLNIKNKTINMIKSLDYNNYIKANNKRTINIENNNAFGSTKNNTDLFDDDKKVITKTTPPDWDIVPPYENVRMVNRK